MWVVRGGVVLLMGSPRRVCARGANLELRNTDQRTTLDLVAVRGAPLRRLLEDVTRWRGDPTPRPARVEPRLTS